MEKDYCKMFNIIEKYLINEVQDIDMTILEAVESRKNGKKYSIEEHIKGMIFALLSNQRDWKPISQNRNIISKIFFDFAAEKIKRADFNYFVKELKSRKLANRSINVQMENLKNNIETFELIENEYGSLDSFITYLKPPAVATLFSYSESPYKLKQMNMALVLEYLRNVGIDTIKPDVHIIRILKRLGLLTDSTREEISAINILEKLSKETNISMAKIDFLLWHYCSESFGNVCAANPNCKKCVIREYCVGNYNGTT